VRGRGLEQLGSRNQLSPNANVPSNPAWQHRRCARQQPSRLSKWQLDTAARGRGLALAHCPRLTESEAVQLHQQTCWPSLALVYCLSVLMMSQLPV
jgi:hypothetical protein